MVVLPGGYRLLTRDRWSNHRMCIYPRSSPLFVVPVPGYFLLMQVRWPDPTGGEILPDGPSDGPP